MELNRISQNVWPLRTVSAPKEVNRTLHSGIHDVINGVAQQAFFYLDVDFKNQDRPTCQIRHITQEPLPITKENQVVLKVFPIAAEPSPNIKGCKIAFCDIQEEQETQFADQEIYCIDGKHFSILQQLVAPSFGGKNALACIKQTTDILGVPILYVSDGSLLCTEKCCKDSALISLKLLEIFKYGKTWYETQGAHHFTNYENINYTIFKLINQYLEKFFEVNVYGKDYLEANFLDLLKKVQVEFNDAFTISKDYLHHLTIERLLKTFEPYKQHPPLSEIYHATIDAAQQTQMPKTATLGELLLKLIDLDNDSNDPNIHQLKHRFLESVISFNYKYLLTYYIEKLSEPKDIRELFLAITMSMVFFEQYLGYFFDLTQPYHNKLVESSEIVSDFLCCCLTYDQASLKTFLEKEIKERGSVLPRSATKAWHLQPPDFMDEFYFSNNYDENLQNVLSQIFLGPDNFDMTYFVLLLFDQLKMMRIAQIECWAPSFTTKLNDIIGEKIFQPGSKKRLGSFITPYKNNKPLLRKIVQALANYLIQSAKFVPVQQITNLDLEEDSIDHFFLAKICAFSLGPFEFQFNSAL